MKERQMTVVNTKEIDVKEKCGRKKGDRCTTACIAN
jgi:hypothetical protein